DRDIKRAWPPFVCERRGFLGLSDEELRRKAGELGPWFLPFPVGNSYTFDIDSKIGRGSMSRVLFRRDLINGTVAAYLGAALGDVTVLDIGCSNGFFSLDLADRGAKHVDGVDLRPENIAQARFLAEYYGVQNVSFSVADADALTADRQWDV